MRKMTKGKLVLEREVVRSLVIELQRTGLREVRGASLQTGWLCTYGCRPIDK